MDISGSIREHEEKYLTFLLKLFRPIESEMMQHVARYEKKINQAMLGELCGTIGLRPPHANLSPTKAIAIKCSFRLQEMIMSVQIISDFQIYFRNFPFRKNGITRERYCRFLLSSYFNEIYMLKERMLGMPMWVARNRSKELKNSSLKCQVDEIRQWVNLVFEEFREIRNTNTHEMRIEDNVLRSVTTTEFFEKISVLTPFLSNISFDYLAEESLRDFRRKWVRYSEIVSLKSHELLAEYCEKIEPLIFDREGNLYPHHNFETVDSEYS